MMKSDSFITVEEMKDTLQVSKSTAYRIARELNNDLKKSGYMVIPGRVSRKYFLERFYGIEETKVGEENASVQG